MACLSTTKEPLGGELPNTPVEKSEMENEEGEEETSEKVYELPSKSFEIRRRFGTLGPAGFDIGDIEDPIQKQLSLEGARPERLPRRVRSTQEADSLYRSKAMPKVGDRGPRVLKVFPGVFIYIFAKKKIFCPKFLVQPG